LEALLPQSYYIFVVAHSIKGRIRRIHVPYFAVHAVVALAVVGAISVLGAVGSYSRMLLKVAHYNHLRQEVEALQKKYNDLQGTYNGQQQQLASLQSLASEVSMAYGIKEVSRAVARQDAGPPNSIGNSVEQYRLLMRATYATPMQRQSFLSDRFSGVRIPSLWPIEGPITGSFGDRNDPFNGEGTFHSGIDISSSYGLPVTATADGVVIFADRYAGYGMMIDIEHGGNVVTRYAHLSGFAVAEGQAVKGGEVLGYVGRSGRTTGAHLHYEVRVNGGPVNPMKYIGHGGFGKAGLRATLGTDE
jgi:murein DD-endopeptidase MepM/ murein hydrolase activator NlpD